MSTAQINFMNIGLMLLSLAAAMTLPFEVFLFSYAVLGPLHYLTEISWLHDRRFFTERKRDWTVLLGFTLLIGIGTVFVMGSHVVKPIETLVPDLFFIAFGLALVFVITKKWWSRVIGAAMLLLLSYFFHGSTAQQMIFALYLPTLIHVFVFTGVFILYGSLKSRHYSGYLSCGVFVLCAAACFVLTPDTTGYVASDYVKDSYWPFWMVNIKLSELLSLPSFTVENAFMSESSWMIMRFIAWAYLYHYLNWFSKTSIIGWHKVSKLRLGVILITWVASLVLYGLDYTVGFKWLFLLGSAHVLLEFPLNHRSFIGIGTEIRQRLRALIAV